MLFFCMDILYVLDEYKLLYVLFFVIINRDLINIFTCKGVLKNNLIGVIILLKLKEENRFFFCLFLRIYRGEK